ncbi:MAG: UDP-N-acetylglucosamine:LPS N-acetylglucosamine transferase [Parcubacteria group bacterium Gr01-1014_31]|nr:MAG: UDP-N-acetylglucosamine:LPS N-acetylglucosamine transferase [Parcubacteria group bacterium Gr01-1014_31]
MGHVKAAEAITAAFAERHPDVTVRNVNVLQFARPAFRFFYENGYNFISSHWTKFWGFLYRRYDRPARHGMLVSLTRWAMERPLLRYVREYRPDFIIGTHPMPTRLLAHVSDKNIAAIPTAVVVTDYGCHSFWVDEATDRYFVSTEDVRRCLGGFRVPPERVAVTGIPVQPKFARPIDAAAARRSLKLPERVPIVLVIGGLLSAGYLERLVPLVRAHAPGTQFLLVTGRDHWLRSQLKRSTLPGTDGVSVYGFVQNMEELLAACDVVITKAGGLTVSECLAMGAVMAIPSAIPGQEEDNLAFLLRHKVAVSAHAPDQLADAVAPLLTDAKLAAERKSACRSLGKPNAAYDLAADVVRQIETRASRVG